MIFAVKPQNVQSIPKIISLLGKIHVIVAPPPKKIPSKYMQYDFTKVKILETN